MFQLDLLLGLEVGVASNLASDGVFFSGVGQLAVEGEAESSRSKEEEEEEEECILTLANLALLLDVPGVQRRPFLVLHGRALVEVLGEVRLVEASGLHHLPLRQVVLLHVAFHHLGYLPRVSSAHGQTHRQTDTHHQKLEDLLFLACIFLPKSFEVLLLQFVASQCSKVK